MSVRSIYLLLTETFSRDASHGYKVNVTPIVVSGLRIPREVLHVT